MDIRWAAILLGTIGAVRTEAAEKILVDVYVQKDGWHQPLEYAEVLASQMFDRSDVRVTWHAGRLPKVPCRGRFCIGIDMLDCAPASVSRGALASALPYGTSGSLIEVYGDRVQLLGGKILLSTCRLSFSFSAEFFLTREGQNGSGSTI
jgi:hypothetical protein